MKKPGFKITSNSSSKWTCNKMFNLSRTGQTNNKALTLFKATSNKKWNWLIYSNKLRTVITTSHPRMKRSLQELSKNLSQWPQSIILPWTSKMRTSTSSSSQQIPKKKETVTFAHLLMQMSKLNTTRRKPRSNIFSKHFRSSDQWSLKKRFLSLNRRSRMSSRKILQT